MGFLSMIENSAAQLLSRKRGSPRYALPVTVESLEHRLLFDAQVNSSSYDAPGVPIVGGQSSNYVSQQEASIVAFDSPGNSGEAVVSAYNDNAMQQFGQVGGFPTHSVGTSFSNGAGFSQTSASPPVLPYVPGGGASDGDGGDPVLAYDKQDATLLLATTSNAVDTVIGGTNNWGPEGIHIYSSTDNGHTFSGAANAIPGAVAQNGTTYYSYDKPWLTVDNNPGSYFGTTYLAYQLDTAPQSSTQTSTLMLTSTTPGQSWPASDGVAVDTTYHNTFFAQILVSPKDDSVYLIYVGVESNGQGHVLMKKITAGNLNALSNTTATTLADFHYNFSSVKPQQLDLPPYATNPNDAGQAYAVGVQVTPTISAAINETPSSTGSHEHIYVAWTDYPNSDNNDNPLIYLLDYDATTKAVGTPVQILGAAAADSAQWEPAVGVSANGGSLFVGYYSGYGIFTIDDALDPQALSYNIDDAIIPVDAGGLEFNSAVVRQLTNLGSGGNPTGAGFPRPDDAFLGDYNTVASDLSNFYFAAAETRPETLSNGSTLNQTDVYMFTVAIPQTGPAMNPPTSAEFIPDDTGGPTLHWDTGAYQSLATAPEMLVEYSMPGQGWEPLASTSGQPVLATAGQFMLAGFSYDPTKTYYFRLRAAYIPADSSLDPSAYNSTSGYSPAIESWVYDKPRIENPNYWLVTVNPPVSSKPYDSYVPGYVYDFHIGFYWLQGDNAGPLQSALFQYSFDSGNTWVDYPAAIQLDQYGQGDATVNLPQPITDQNTVYFRARLLNAPDAPEGFSASPLSPPFIASALFGLDSAWENTDNSGNPDIIVSWYGGPYENVEVQIIDSNGVVQADVTSPTSARKVEINEGSQLSTSQTYFVKIRCFHTGTGGSDPNRITSWTTPYQLTLTPTPPDPDVTSVYDTYDPNNPFDPSISSSGGNVYITWDGTRYTDGSVLITIKIENGSSETPYSGSFAAVSGSAEFDNVDTSLPVSVSIKYAKYYWVNGQLHEVDSITEYMYIPGPS